MNCEWTLPFVSFFLWHLTWGWRQLLCHILFLSFFLFIVIPLSWSRSLLYSLFFHCITTIVIVFCMKFIVMACDVAPAYNTEAYVTIYTNIQRVTLLFALEYNICMYCIVALLKDIFQIPLGRLVVVLFLSGITSALTVPFFIHFS